LAALLDGNNRQGYDTSNMADKTIEKTEPNESALLIAFAHAASKAQEIEGLQQDTVVSAEALHDTRNRPFSEIVKEIDKLPLGPLKKKYLKTIGKPIEDPNFEMMWNDINEDRNFLMHKFFRIFPVAGLAGNKEAANKLARIDEMLDIGRRLLKDVLNMTLVKFNIPPAQFRTFLAALVDRRNKLRTRDWSR
jgi:hypothetical protein